MNGTATETVASSWIEALGGVSMCWIFSIPPDFWADTGLAECKSRRGGKTEASRSGFHCFLPDALTLYLLTLGTPDEFWV